MHQAGTNLHEAAAMVIGDARRRQAQTMVYSEDRVRQMDRLYREGILYKKREVFGQWRPRFCVVDEKDFKYFESAKDTQPRDRLPLARVIAVMTGQRKEMFTFTIQEKGNKTLHFGAMSKEDACEWVMIINTAVKRLRDRHSASSRKSSNAQPVKPQETKKVSAPPLDAWGDGSRRSSLVAKPSYLHFAPTEVETDPSSYSSTDESSTRRSSDPESPSMSDASICHSTPVEATYSYTEDTSASHDQSTTKPQSETNVAGASEDQTISMHAASSLAHLLSGDEYGSFTAELDHLERKFKKGCDKQSQWSIVGEEGDMKAYQRGEGSRTVVLGRGLIYHNPRCMWKTILEPNRRTRWNAELQRCSILRRISNHTFLLYSRYKAEEWPRAVDFTTVVHWKVETDDAILILERSIVLKEIPEQPECVRGRNLFHAWRLTPVENYTMTDVTYMASADHNRALSTNQELVFNESLPFLANRVAGLLDVKPLEEEERLGPLTNSHSCPSMAAKGNKSLTPSKRRSSPVTIGAVHSKDSSTPPGANIERPMKVKVGLPQLPPDEFSVSLSRVERAFYAEADDAQRWTLFSEDLDVLSFSKDDKGIESFLSKGEIHFSPKEVWKAVLTGRMDYDTLLDETKRVHDLNTQTYLYYSRLKSINGKPAREFTTVTHWKVTSDSTILILETAALPSSATAPSIKHTRVWRLAPGNDYSTTTATLLCVMDYGRDLREESDKFFIKSEISGHIQRLRHYLESSWEENASSCSPAPLTNYSKLD